MKQQFHEFTNGLSQSVTRRGTLKKFGLGVTGMALVGLVGLSNGAFASTLGPLIELSRPIPVAGCDIGLTLPGTWTPNVACEPVLTANPINARNLVAMWFIGPAQNAIAGVTLDGGRTWQQVPLPITVCSGGAFLGAADPALSFAPNGDLYAINAAGDSFSASGIAVNKSTDGGLHWSAPIFLTDATGLPADRPTISADPTDARFAYAFWKRNDINNRTPAVFSRTTDGGSSWEPPRDLVYPDPQNHVDTSQLFVLPDGTLVDLFFLYYQGPNQPPKTAFVQRMMSTDHGLTWSTPVTVLTVLPLSQPNSTGFNLIVDPETGWYLQDAGDPVFAMDTRNGNLYAVWEDGRFSNFQNNEIAFSMSADGGLTWSAPIRVNQTPLTTSMPNRQAFLPSIAVASDGTIAVSYYDFRFNSPNSGLPTDYWLVRCTPSTKTPATIPANWSNEVRLTDASFNLESALVFGNEFFLGDYINGLASTGTDFVAAFTRVDPDGVNSIVARRVYK